jgi:hypothetical protein
MRSRLIVCAVVLASGSGFAFQEPKKSGNDNSGITVTGCLDGGYLRVYKADSVGYYAERYRLAGSKQLLKEMASKHNGSLVEVTGRVKSAPGTEHLGETVQIGKKTKIYTGAKDVPRVPTGDDTSTLEVKSYRKLQETCSGQR